MVITLQKPLDREEEAKYMAMLNGPEREDAVKALTERNLRLVAFVARKFKNTGIEDDDLFSIGSIGLMKAVKSFKHDKKVKLATYATRCISNEILMHLRKQKHLKVEVSLDEPLNVDSNGNELLLSDILGTENDTVSRDIEREVDYTLLMCAMQKLPVRDSRIIELRYSINSDGEGLSQKEVSQIMNISQSYVSRLEKKILQKMKREIARMS